MALSLPFPRRLSGHRVLLVEKVVSTGRTLMQFIASMQQRIEAQRAAAAASGAAYESPVLGCFVLIDKEDLPGHTTAELPAELKQDGRYFVAEHVSSQLMVGLPFHVDGALPAMTHIHACVS